MKKSVSKALFGLMFLVVIAGVVYLLFMQNSKKEKRIVRTGQIEMKEYNVASKIPGRIEWIKVEEGDVVSIGQQIFKLTDRELRAKLGQADASIYSAKAQWNMALEGARAEQIDIANRGYLAAKSQFELAEKTYNRMKIIHQDSLISDQDFDVVSQKYSSALAAMEAAKLQYDMAFQGARQQEKEMAQGQYMRAVQSKEEVNSYLDETVSLAPIGGIISKRYFNEGELIAIGYPVVAIIDTTDVWAELNLPETILQNIKVGDEIEGKIHGVGTAIKFKVVNFSVMADFANWRAQNERANYEVRSFTVKLKPVGGTIHSLRPGMTVSFDLGPEKEN